MEEKKEDIKKETSVSEREIEKRRKELINFFKQKTNLVVYGILAIIISISVFIRTRNISKLKDITTGTWTLGPDLDPFLFLRWAKYIAEHGKLFLIDTMRYVPLANFCSGDACNPINTTGEMKLLSYMIAWLSNFLSIFSKEATVTYAAIIFPVIMAALTGVAFFLFARKVFYKENKKIANIIALIATSFFVLIPSLLPRTIAGIPEKESAAFFFIFLGFYFFLEAYTSEKLKKGIIFGLLSGVMAGLLGLIWGGIDYVFIIMAGTILFAYLLGKIDEKRFYIYGIWIAGFLITAMPFSIRYSISNLLGSVQSELVFIVFFILLIDFLLFKKKIIKIPEKLNKTLNKIPHQMTTIIIGFVLLIILASMIFGVSFIQERVSAIVDQTIHPISEGRFSVTVAENKPSYFISDWEGEFGPIVFNIPLYFWMMIFGSVLLFSNLIEKMNKKEKIFLILSYFIFLIGLIFSKYAPHPNLLDGEGTLSLIVYFGGALFFIITFGIFYFRRYKAGEISIFKEFNFAYILYFVLLTMTIIGARGAVRLIMVLGAVSPIAVAFLIVKGVQKYLKEKEDMKKLLSGVLVLILLLASAFTLWTYYQDDKALAENYAPNFYTQQWQKAMSWVRENTSVDAIFAHWWDYGYWVQSIGERATILDGGNAIGYWNYFMGRNVLTGTNERGALDFLYTHNGTHLLIDSTDIGKYGAFSSIGSDANYDRYSWIQTILRDDTQTTETNNATFYLYQAGSILDEDVILHEGNEEILLPKNKAYVGAIITQQKTNGEILQPKIVFIYNNKQYSESLRYIYTKDKLYDFNSGIEAGIFVFPEIEVTASGGVNLVQDGAALYLSRRVINSQLAKLYLFNKNSNYFKLVHSEDNLIISDLKKQGMNLDEFVYYAPAGGLLGPIKIWEISYPNDIKLNQSYLDTDYPAELATVYGGN